MKNHSIAFTVGVNAPIHASPSESVFIRVHPWLNCRFYVDRSRNKMISNAESAETRREKQLKEIKPQMDTAKHGEDHRWTQMDTDHRKANRGNGEAVTNDFYRRVRGDTQR